MLRTRTITPATFLRNNTPLKLLVSNSYPLYNFKTVIDIFIKLGTNIKLRWTIYREQEPQFHHFFSELFSLEIFSMKIVSLQKL